MHSWTFNKYDLLFIRIICSKRNLFVQIKKTQISTYNFSGVGKLPITRNTQGLSWIEIFICIVVVWVAKSCPTRDSKDCNLLGFSVLGILQASILEWVAISFTRVSSWPSNWIQVSYTAGRFLCQLRLGGKP